MEDAKMQMRIDYRMGPVRELGAVCHLNDRPQTGGYGSLVLVTWTWVELTR